MKEKKKELKGKRIINSLEEIFSGVGIIAGGMRIFINGFGSVIATSKVNYHINNGCLTPYFTFQKTRREQGEFFRENNRYFIKWKGAQLA